MKKSISVLLYVTVSLFSLGQIGRLSFLGQQVNAYIYEIPLFLLTALLIFQYRSKPFQIIKKKLVALPIFLVYLSGVFVITSFFYSFIANSVGILYLLRLIFYFTFFVYLWQFVQNDKKNYGSFFNAILLGAVLTIIFSVVQYFLYPNLRNISYLGWDPHWFRMVGTFLDPPISGAIYGLFFIYFYFKKKPSSSHFSSFPQHIWKWAPMILFSICLFLTYSRGTYLAFIVSVIILLKKKIALTLLLIVCIGGLIYMFLPKPYGESVNLLRTASIYSRLSNYEEAFSGWSKSPIIGVGYNRIRYTRSSADFVNKEDLETNHAGASYHSTFLIVLVTGGVVGLVLFIWLLYSFALLSKLSTVVVVFLSLLSLTDNVLFHPFVLFLFLFMIASSLINPSYK
jgi:hypothetical protein